MLSCKQSYISVRISRRKKKLPLTFFLKHLDQLNRTSNPSKSLINVELINATIQDMYTGIMTVFVAIPDSSGLVEA